jgi:outer membrane lipoprotein-sorting protein
VQYTQPERQLLVSDGKQRWLYLEKINQVQIQALPPAGDANEFFLELGGGLPALVARCQVKRLAAEETKEQRAYQLTPRPNESLQFQQVKIWISRADQLPRRVVVEAERRVEARFKNISIHTLKQLSQAPDKGLPPSRFTFQAPKDAEVIEMLWPSK